MQPLTAPQQVLLSALLRTDQQQLSSGILQSLAEVRAFAQGYFGMYCLDWCGAPLALQAQGLAILQTGQIALTEHGMEQAAQLRLAHPRFVYAYNEFFYRARRSPAHARFCERVYGRDLCQHGMADMPQVDDLAAYLRAAHVQDFLELGCGNGAVTAYLAQAAGARATGVDIAEEGITWGQTFASQQPNRLTLLTADMAEATFPAESFDAILLIDAVYFVRDPLAFIPRLMSYLRPDGKLYTFFSAWAGPSDPADQLESNVTHVARALHALALHYQVVDYSAAEALHWQRKLQAAVEMRPEFEAEGQSWLYQRRWSEAEKHRPYVESGRIRRYLYIVQKAAL